MTVQFKDPSRLDHLVDRIQMGKAIWFKQGCAKEAWVNEDRKTVSMLIECKGIRGREFDED